MSESTSNQSHHTKEKEKNETEVSQSTLILTNQMNIMLILLVGLFIFNIYLFFKVKGLETDMTKGAGAGGAANVVRAENENPLSEESLIVYAKDLKLNEKKFTQCLQNNEKEEKVNSDMEAGQNAGVSGTPGFLINGRFLSGAMPFSVFQDIIDTELRGEATGNCSDYSEAVQQYCDPEAERQLFKPEPIDFTISEGTPVKGKENAPVQIVEFSDFQCPFCTRAYDTMNQIAEAYPNNVALYFKQFPLTNIHPQAFQAAEASLCAHDQGKFWDYHDTLFEVQKK